MKPLAPSRTFGVRMHLRNQKTLHIFVPSPKGKNPKPQKTKKQPLSVNSSSLSLFDFYSNQMAASVLLRSLRRRELASPSLSAYRAVRLVSDPYQMIKVFFVIIPFLFSVLFFFSFYQGFLDTCHLNLSGFCLVPWKIE